MVCLTESNAMTCIIYIVIQSIYDKQRFKICQICSLINVCHIHLLLNFKNLIIPCTRIKYTSKPLSQWNEANGIHKLSMQCKHFLKLTKTLQFCSCIDIYQMHQFENFRNLFIHCRVLKHISKLLSQWKQSNGIHKLSIQSKQLDKLDKTFSLIDICEVH